MSDAMIKIMLTEFQARQIRQALYDMQQNLSTLKKSESEKIRDEAEEQFESCSQLVGYLNQKIPRA